MTSRTIFLTMISIAKILFLISCNQSENHNITKKIVRADTIQNSPISYDTLPNGIRLLDNLDSGMNFYYREVVGSNTLKGGYITCYGIDDSSKYFYLRHGDTLKLLNKIPKSVTTWAVGTLEKDLPTFFIIRIDNGNGVPGTYQVFDKQTAKNLLGDNVEVQDYKYVGQTLFFLYKDADSIFLYNVKSGRREGFELPKEYPNDEFYYELKDLKKHSLTMIRQGHLTHEEKLLKYRR